MVAEVFGADDRPRDRRQPDSANPDNTSAERTTAESAPAERTAAAAPWPSPIGLFATSHTV